MNNLKFGHLISHTFPGFILFFEIVGFLMIVTPDVDKIISSLSELRPLFGTIIFSGFIVISTILGLIIDSINHFFFDLMWEPRVYEIHKEIETKDQLDIFRYLIDEQIYHYYECYINILISLIPGLVIIPLVLHRFLKVNCVVWLFLSVLVILFIIGVLFYEGKITYDEVYKHEEEFIENIRKRREEKNKSTLST